MAQLCGLETRSPPPSPRTLDNRRGCRHPRQLFLFVDNQRSGLSTDAGGETRGDFPAPVAFSERSPWDSEPTAVAPRLQRVAPPVPSSKTNTRDHARACLHCLSTLQSFKALGKVARYHRHASRTSIKGAKRPPLIASMIHLRLDMLFCGD